MNAPRTAAQTAGAMQAASLSKFSIHFGAVAFSLITRLERCGRQALADRSGGFTAALFGLASIEHTAKSTAKSGR